MPKYSWERAPSLGRGRPKGQRLQAGCDTPRVPSITESAPQTLGAQPLSRHHALWQLLLPASPPDTATTCQPSLILTRAGLETRGRCGDSYRTMLSTRGAFGPMRHKESRLPS
jgi:hypothetical protein